MNLLSWLRRSTTRWNRARARRIAPCPASHLRLEVLEDRTVPSAVNLNYSSYLANTGWAVAVDSSGDTYTADAQTVAKVNATGTALDWVYSLNGGVATSIAVDANGNVYVTGYESQGGGSTINVPLSANALATSGGQDFFAVLNSAGTTLEYSTVLPGTTMSNGYLNGYYGRPALAIAPSSSGSLDNVYLTGQAGSGLLTTGGAFQSSAASSEDAYFMEINPNLSGSAGLVYGSYLGGSGDDEGTGVAVDGAGNAYLTGVTASSNFPTTAGAFQPTDGGGQHTFVTKINPSLSGAASLVYSTYLAGNGTDGISSEYPYVPVSVEPGPAIAVDAAGDAYVTGATNSSNFPTTPGAYQTTFDGGSAYVTKLNAAGTGLIYSTYLGGPYTGAYSIALDANDDAYVTGWTRSTTFPTLNPVQAAKGSGDNSEGESVSNAFVTTLNSSGSGLLFSTYLGGSGTSSSNGDVYGYGIAVDSVGNVYVAGSTHTGGEAQSTSYPTTAGVFDTMPGGGFLSQISPVLVPSFQIAGPSSLTAGTTGTFTITALNANGTPNSSYSGPVTLTSSDPKASLPTGVTLANGTASFNATLYTAGIQSLTATAGSISGSDAAITINPGAATHLSISGPSSVAPNTAFSITVTALDAYGNVATGYRGTITFTDSVSGAMLPSSYTFTATDAGVHTFTGLKLKTKGTQTLTIDDTLDSIVADLTISVS